MAEPAQPTTPEGAPQSTGGAEPKPDTPAEGKTFTQAELDAIVQDRIQRERKKYDGFDDLKAKAAKLDELEDAQRSDLERLETRATEAEGKLTPLQQENARLKVAVQKGLVGDRAFLVDRLKGETEEELSADADELLKQFPATDTTPPPPPDFAGGPRTPAAEAKTPEAAHNELIAGLTGHLPQNQ